jgi:DNA primase
MSGLLSLLEDIGIESLHPDGDEIWGRCPAHPHRECNPHHWSISRTKLVSHCFSCGYGGSLVRLVMV